MWRKEQMIEKIFDPEADQKKYEFWMRSVAPSRTYSILFTPRSGSSWLTSILTQSKALGTPSEWFNPSLMPASAQAKGARNLDQFVNAISRHEIHGGIFGFEITYHQLLAVFENEHQFMNRFSDAEFFWLIRKDIVSQGISLDKMVQTNVSHASNNDEAEIRNSDTVYGYDADRIKKWIKHIHVAEMGTEKMIADFGLSPIRLSYEGITSEGAQKTLEIFSSKLGVDLPAVQDTSSQHRKIGTSKNSEFSERFCAENQEFLDGIFEEREKFLSLHN